MSTFLRQVDFIKCYRRIATPEQKMTWDFQIAILPPQTGNFWAPGSSILSQVHDSRRRKTVPTKSARPAASWHPTTWSFSLDRVKWAISSFEPYKSAGYIPSSRRSAIMVFISKLDRTIETAFHSLVLRRKKQLYQKEFAIEAFLNF